MPKTDRRYVCEVAFELFKLERDHITNIKKDSFHVLRSCFAAAEQFTEAAERYCRTGSLDATQDVPADADSDSDAELSDEGGDDNDSGSSDESTNEVAEKLLARVQRTSKPESLDALAAEAEQQLEGDALARVLQSIQERRATA